MAETERFDIENQERIIYELDWIEDKLNLIISNLNSSGNNN